MSRWVMANIAVEIRVGAVQDQMVSFEKQKYTHIAVEVGYKLSA